MGVDASLKCVAEQCHASAISGKHSPSVGSIVIDDWLALVVLSWIRAGEDKLSVDDLVAVGLWAGAVRWWLNAVGWRAVVECASTISSALHSSEHIESDHLTILNGNWAC